MDQLSNLLGGQGGGALQTILGAFQSGQHHQASDQDVSSTYGQVTQQLPRDQYQQAARDAFSRMTPEERQEFLEEMQNGASVQGLDPPTVQNATSDPDSLAQATSQLHEQQPGSLGQLFALGGTFGSPVAKAALLGITAMAAQQLLGNRR